MRRGVPAIGVAALQVVTVAAGLMGDGWPHYRIAVAPRPAQAYFSALTGGVLQGRANIDGTACLWLGDARITFGLGGARADAMALSWPYGFSAGGWPIAVYDAAGKRGAIDGQRVEIGGGLVPDSVLSITGCSGFAAYWFASPEIRIRGQLSKVVSPPSI